MRKPSLATCGAADPGTVAADPAMPFVERALDHVYMRRAFEELLARSVRLDDIRVTRWKPGRRCLIEYDVRFDDDTEPAGTLVGKVRARSFDRSTYALTREVADRLRSTSGASCVSVPPVRGAIPDCHMWLQDKVVGEPAWSRINGGAGADTARRVGRALAGFHRALPQISKQHTMAEELAILAEALHRVDEMQPAWHRRLRSVRKACERAAAALPQMSARAIHRDFYHDQVLVSADRVWILDLDLAAAGDPALDVGNFLAHVAEQSLRMFGNADRGADAEAAFIEGFHQAGGDAPADAIAVFKTLSLARHIYISTVFESRRRFTGALLSLCEQRLQL